MKLDENAVGPKPTMYFKKQMTEKTPSRNDGALFAQRCGKCKKTRILCTRCQLVQGESIDYVKTAIFDKKAPIYQLLDFKPVNELVSQHLYGKENRRLFIWSLLNVNHYLKNIF